jgi:hypothetical protein
LIKLRNLLTDMQLKIQQSVKLPGKAPDRTKSEKRETDLDGRRIPADIVGLRWFVRWGLAAGATTAIAATAGDDC